MCVNHRYIHINLKNLRHHGFIVSFFYDFWAKSRVLPSLRSGHNANAYMERVAIISGLRPQHRRALVERRLFRACALNTGELWWRGDYFGLAPSTQESSGGRGDYFRACALNTGELWRERRLLSGLRPQHRTAHQRGDLHQGKR